MRVLKISSFVALALGMIAAPCLAAPATDSNTGMTASLKPWGDLAKMIGWWSATDAKGEKRLVHYRWDEKSKVLIVDHHDAEGGLNTDVITLGPDNNLNFVLRVPNQNNDGVPTGTFTNLKRNAKINSSGALEISENYSEGKSGITTRHLKNNETMVRTIRNYQAGILLSTFELIFQRVPAELGAVLLKQQGVHAQAMASVEKRIQEAGRSREIASQRRARALAANAAAERQRWEEDMAELQEEQEVEWAAIDESNRRGAAERMQSVISGASAARALGLPATGRAVQTGPFAATSNGTAGESANVGLIVKDRDYAAEAQAAAELERESSAKAAAYAAVRAKEEADRLANEAKDAAWRAAQDAKMKATQSERCRRMAANPNAAARCI